MIFQESETIEFKAVVTALQISNMVRDAIKPDLTMFLHYETLEFGGKRIIAVDIQRGTEPPIILRKSDYDRRAYMFGRAFLLYRQRILLSVA